MDKKKEVSIVPSNTMPATFDAMSAILSTTSDIPPGKAEVLKTLVQSDTLKYQTDRQEETKICAEKENTKQTFINRLFEFMGILVKFAIKAIVAVAILTLLGSLGLVAYAVTRNMQDALLSVEKNLENSTSLPGFMVDWINMMIGIAQIIVPLFF